MTDNNDEQAELTDGEEETENDCEHEMMEGDDSVDPHETEYRRGDKRPLDHGVKIRGKAKRGTGTYDHDELLIEGRGEDAEEAVADFETALCEAEERGWSDRLRNIRPEEDEDDE